MPGPETVGLEVTVTGAAPDLWAAAPTLVFGLHLSDPGGGPVHAVVLRAQVRIEPQRRRYDERAGEQLAELFGGRDRWSSTLKPFALAELVTMVPAFEAQTEAELAMTCSYDLEVAGGRYLHALDGGEVPLLFLFSGTVFRVSDGRLSVTPISWASESRFPLPVAAWREAIDRFFPGSAWLRLQRDTVDALVRFKSAEAQPTWDGTLDLLLERAGVRR